MRPSTPQMLAALKLATRSSLANAGGAAAIVRERIVRIKETALSFAGSANEEHAERFVGIDVALDLDFAAGEPHHARALAYPQGYDLVPRRPVPASGLVGPCDIRTMTREAAELSEVMFAAFEDGRVCRADSQKILRELADIEEFCRTLRAKCEAVL